MREVKFGDTSSREDQKDDREGHCGRAQGDVRVGGRRSPILLQEVGDRGTRKEKSERENHSHKERDPPTSRHGTKFNDGD